MSFPLLHIDLARLISTFEVSSKIGATENGGLNRLSLSNEDKEIRDIFVEWLKNEGLNVRIDDMGNIYGRREGKKAGGGVVMIGSHLDTMPMAGRFDGIAGVLSALEVIRTLNEHGIETERPIEIVNFTNEEGERFPPPMQGSGVITGNYEKEIIYNTKDKEGITFEKSLRDIGYMGKIQNRPTNVEYFIEIHIEQGPILEENQKQIGIVNGVKGSKRFKVTLKGKSSHGAYPNSHRRDPLIAASEMVLVIDNAVKQFEGLTTSLGVFEVFPSVESQTTETVHFTFAVRHIDDATKDRAIEIINNQMNEIAKRKKIDCEVTQVWKANGTYFSKEILDIIEKGAEAYGYSHQYIIAPALHDAKFMNDIAKTAMIFTPSVGGLSHCGDEYTSYEDLERETNVLLYTVLSLANKV